MGEIHFTDAARTRLGQISSQPTLPEIKLYSTLRDIAELALLIMAKRGQRIFRLPFLGLKQHEISVQSVQLFLSERAAFAFQAFQQVNVAALLTAEMPRFIRPSKNGGHQRYNKNRQAAPQGQVNILKILEDIDHDGTAAQQIDEHSQLVQKSIMVFEALTVSLGNREFKSDFPTIFCTYFSDGGFGGTGLFMVTVIVPLLVSVKLPIPSFCGVWVGCGVGELGVCWGSHDLSSRLLDIELSPVGSVSSGGDTRKGCFEHLFRTLFFITGLDHRQSTVFLPLSLLSNGFRREPLAGRRSAQKCRPVLFKIV